MNPFGLKIKEKSQGKKLANYERFKSLWESSEIKSANHMIERNT